MPDKLEELKRLWLVEAVKYNVLPIDDRTAERFNAQIAGRPDLMMGRKNLLLGPGMGRLSENSVLNVKNKSFSVTAEILVRDDLAEGVILSQGGRFGGWSLYIKGGRLKFCYNYVGLEQYYAESGEPVAAGNRQVRAELAYDGGGLGKGGTLSLYVDGRKVGEGRIEKTQPFIFSADETMDVGYEAGSHVTDDLPMSDAFPGTIQWVDVSIGPEEFDHFIDPQAFLRIAMVRQ
jgi:arylsulfatase